MKRLICISLLLAILTGCGASVPSSKNTIHFYYPRQAFHYASSDGSMGMESRELTDWSDDLNYMIHLYLLGPQEDTLTSIFPKNTRLLSSEMVEDSLIISRSPVDNALSDIQYTFAAACLARTCLGIVPAQSVTIRSGDREITLTTDNMLLMDDSATLETEEK